MPVLNNNNIIYIILCIYVHLKSIQCHGLLTPVITLNNIILSIVQMSMLPILTVLGSLQIFGEA